MTAHTAPVRAAEKMHIEITDSLNAADKAHLMGWSERVFPEEGRQYSWTESTHHIVAYESAEPVAHLGFGLFEIQNGDQAEQVIGVGGVVVRPEWQGQRIPNRLFAHLHSTDVLDARDRIFTLFCPARLEPYYAHMGYKNFEGDVLIPDGEGVKRFAFSFMYRGDAGFRPVITLTTNPW